MADQSIHRTAQMMYENALNHLSNGIMSPFDQNVLSYTPLPDSVTDPYVTQDVDALQTMNMTNNALNAWIEESKKASYFTKHFVTLSRLIMNGVAAMARGLVTLHLRGQDLEQAPMSIGDLISVSSYQFRKSYLGVLQTVKTRPEISERLLMNQLGWNNTLIKLFKTRDKLSRPAPVQKTAGCEIQCSAADASALADGAPESESVHSLSAGSSAAECNVSEIRELPALSEPGSYGAIRAFAPYKGNAKGMKRRKNEEGRMKKEQGAGSDKNAEFGIRNAESGLDEEKEEKRTERNVRNEDGRMKNEEGQTETEVGNEEERMKNEYGRTENELGNDEGDFKRADENGGSPLDPEHPPEFLKILYRALCRSAGSEDGTIEYTLEEVRLLLSDPEFCYYKPELAAEMRGFLKSAVDDGSH